MPKKVYVALVLLIVSFTLNAQDRRSLWADSVLQKLSVSQKIRQLFVLPVTSKTDESAKIKSLNPGAIILSGVRPENRTELISHLQASSEIPLLVAAPSPWQPGEIPDSVPRWPSPMIQSSWTNDSLNYKLGRRMASELKKTGVHIQFGPKVDVFSNQPEYENYFSNNRARAARKSALLMSGLQDNGIIACATTEGHPGPMPFIDVTSPVDMARLDTTDLYGFLQLIQDGLGALSATHIDFNTFENAARKKSVPAAASSLFITDVLRKGIGFKGLMFADMAYVQANVSKKKKGEIEEMSFRAGIDLMIAPPNPAAAEKVIRKAIKKDPSLLEQLNASVRRILLVKYDAGLFTMHKNRESKIVARDKLEDQRLAEASVSVLRNENDVVPVRMLEDRRFISLSVGRDDKNLFNHVLQQYAPVTTLAIQSEAEITPILSALGHADVIIINAYNGSAALQDRLAQGVRGLPAGKQVIVCLFGNPMDAARWPGVQAILAAPGGRDVVPRIAAEIVFGGVDAKGVSPVDLDNQIRAGLGLMTTTTGRFQYTWPEFAGMDSKTLEFIQQIAQEAIDNKAFPGCRVFVARHRKVIYDRSFGYLTYDRKIPVTDETIYDLASVTKVSATLQTVTFMVERGLIDVNKKVSFYLPELRNSNKKDLVIKDVLTHQAGLWPFLPFWAQTVKDTVHLPEYYSNRESPDYPFPVSENLFATKTMKDSLWQWIINAKMVEKTARTPYDYRYSDMGFYIMQHLAERILNQPIEEFLQQNIYDPLGAYTIGYLPLRRFPASRIAPTENDKLFRRSQLVGYVHDQGAAMHGGIAGHAGLFSTANDLGKLAQMWLEKGTYGGERYFKTRTIEQFTEKQFELSRRGLGWDRGVQGMTNGPTSMFASPKTFGHTGFTGTCIWVDPEFDLVFIFLSNRVYPDMNNNKILNDNIRPRIQDVVYRSIFNYCDHQAADAE